MNQNIAIYLLIATAFVLANLPWLFERRLFLFIDLKRIKPFWLGLVEWGVYFSLSVLFGYLLEKRVMGTVSPQDWEFWVTVFFMFMIFAFPGFIYRYNFRRYLCAAEKHSG